MTEGPQLELFTVGATQVAELKGGALATENDAVDLVGNSSYLGAEYVLVGAAQLPADFYDLSTGFAGEVMQKFANYRVGLVIVGDLGEVVGTMSESLLALVRESNRGHHVWFVEDRDEAIGRIAAAI